MDSLKYWKPELASGTRKGMGLALRFAFSRLFVLVALAGLSSLWIPKAALAQNPTGTVSLSLSTTTFVEGDPNVITGTVAVNGPAITSQVTVNVFYELPRGSGQQTLVETVVFGPGEQNVAKNINITVGDDNLTGNQPVAVIARARGQAENSGATAPVNAVQIDPRGIFLTDIGARTSEGDAQRGTTTFFDVSLVDPNNPSANLAELTPTGNVFVTLRVARPADGEFSEEALIATENQPIFQQEQVLIFTPQNFQQSQRVFVQGVDDNPPAADGDQLFRVLVRAVNSNDPEYNNLAGSNGVGTSVFGLNLDNEANPGPDIIISPASIETNENGSNGTFTVVLATQPKADVTINFQTSDPTEGRLVRQSDNALVTSTSITFSPDETADNGFSTPQTVTVRGVDDALADGDINYRIITTVSGGDPEYAAIDPADVAATNNDNETEGLTVSPNFLVIFEGQTATITAVLNKAPTANVRFALRVDDPSEVQLNRTDVVFSPQNFNQPQTVIVTALNDNLVDGDQPFKVFFDPANSSDPNYNGKFATKVDGTVVDTNSARVNIQPPGGLVTTEAGGTATFSVSLASMPQPGIGGNPDNTVTIVVTSSDTTEGLVSVNGSTPAGSVTLTFTRQNFNVPQTVTITGVDDLLRDGNVDYQINLDISGSSDQNYAGLDLQPVTVTNNDAGETVGITFSTLGGLSTTEAGGTATFTVQLTAQPTSNVTLGLSSSDTTEGTVSPSSIIFTPTDFNQPRTVTVTGVNDLIDDGNVTYNVVTAALVTNDPTYKFNPQDVIVTNLDDDARGITVTPTSGLVTTESGGKATFTVKLDSQPTDNVAITLSTPFTSEVSISPSTLLFTPQNFSAPQTVTLTGVNDQAIDGARTFVIVTSPANSADPNYNGLNAADVVGTNNDNDRAAILLSPNPLVVSEGETADLFIRLSAQPTSNVIVPLSLDPTDQVVLDKNQLTFTPQNFNTAQRVRVTGLADGVSDGNQIVTLNVGPTVSSDTNFNGLTVAPPPTINVLDVVATPGLLITGPNTNIVSENGGVATFDVSLATRPGASVMVNVTSSDTTEGTVSPTTLTFSSTDFNTPQRVTVRGMNDDDDDGNVNFTVTFSKPISADPNYSSVAPRSFSFVNVDNDIAGFTVKPTNTTQTGLRTTEGGGSDTFTVRLNSRPKANVTITISTPQTKEVSIAPTTLTFTPTNFSTVQTVTVRGVDDTVQDGNRTFVIVTNPATSADPQYSGLNPPDLTGINADNETFGYTFAPTFLVVEEGSTTTFTLRLNLAPSAPVRVPISSSDTSEVRVNTSALIFTPQNFATPQTVTLTGVDDNLRDGDQPFNLVIGNAISSDLNYNGKFGTTVPGTCIDTDVPGVSVNAVSPLTTTEAGGTATFTVALQTAPQGTNTVTINVLSSDTTEGTVTPTTLTFDANNSGSPQTVTVTGVDDAIRDGNQAYRIELRIASTSDPDYVGLSVPSIEARNLDNDSPTPGINVTPTSGFVLAEGSGRGTFTVGLTTQPTGPVIVRMKSSDTTEAAVNFSSITFFPNAPTSSAPPGQLYTQWNQPATVTISALPDGMPDGNQPWRIVLSRDAGVTQDNFYDTIDPEDVTGVTTDVNVAGVTIVGATTLITRETDVKSGTSAAFFVNLQAKPASDVVVPLRVSNRTEAALRVPNSTEFALAGTLTFTPTNYGTPQRVLVRGLDDQVEDGDQPYVIQVEPTISRSTPYNGINAPDVPAVNKDDDDRTAPTTSIASPTDGAIVNFIQEITGVADDTTSSGNGLTSGIASVKVRLFRLVNVGLGQNAPAYYNTMTRTFDARAEDTFDPAVHQIAARYDSASKAFSALLPLSGKPPSLESGTYRAIARATDRKGNFSDSAAVTFVVDTIKPLVRITSPTGGRFSTPPQVQGVAQDNSGGTGIDQVFIKVFRAENLALGNTDGFLLPDGTFSDTEGPENLLPVVQEEPGAGGDVRFTFDLPALGAGQYTITAVAQDVAGNIATTPGVTITLRNVSGAEDFLVGQTYLFSLPYANTADAGATVRPNEAFNVAMFDPVTGDQRYLLSRFNPLTSSYEILDENALLRRGEGYLIKPLTTSIRILRPSEDESRVPLDRSITTWTYTLRRNGSASANDPNNGFNLIGDPFHPDFYLAADWQNATFTATNPTTGQVESFQGVTAAAANGLVDSRLFVLNSVGAFEPTSGNLEAFKGYFVRAFRDNVQVTVRAISATQ